MTDSTPHGSQVPASGPAGGHDEWVARHAERRVIRGGPLGELEQRLRRVPWWAWLTLFLAAFSLFPVVESSGYVRRVAFDTVLYMLLALGLNVVVGWGGLLDLGYVAFYAVGAYLFALLASPQLLDTFPAIKEAMPKATKDFNGPSEVDMVAIPVDAPSVPPLGPRSASDRRFASPWAMT